MLRIQVKIRMILGGFMELSRDLFFTVGTQKLMMLEILWVHLSEFRYFFVSFSLIARSYRVCSGCPGIGVSKSKFWPVFWRLLKLSSCPFLYKLSTCGTDYFKPDSMSVLLRVARLFHYSMSWSSISNNVHQPWFLYTLRFLIIPIRITWNLVSGQT